MNIRLQKNMRKIKIIHSDKNLIVSEPAFVIEDFDPIDITYIKYRDQLTSITCDHYGKTVTLKTSQGKDEFVFKGSKVETVRKVCESILRLIDAK